MSMVDVKIKIQELLALEKKERLEEFDKLQRTLRADEISAIVGGLANDPYVKRHYQLPWTLLKENYS